MDLFSPDDSILHFKKMIYVSASIKTTKKVGYVTDSKQMNNNKLNRDLVRDTCLMGKHICWRYCRFMGWAGLDKQDKNIFHVYMGKIHFFCKVVFYVILTIFYSSIFIYICVSIVGGNLTASL